MSNRKAPSDGPWFRRVEASLWLLVLVVLLYRVIPAEDVRSVAEEGAAPSFTVRTLEGDRLELDDLRGRVVLVNFWATWCPPCRLEMPGFQEVWDQYRDHGFTVVGLAADAGGPATVGDFVQAHGITYPVAMADRALQARYGGIDALPQSFLLDGRGRVRKRVTGVFSEAALRKAVEGLLAEEAAQ
jgi:peroxiredoxin